MSEDISTQMIVLLELINELIFVYLYEMPVLH